MIDRGNAESLVFFCMALFIHFYQQERRFLGNILLSAAIAMKLFPIFFLVLMIADKKYKDTIYTIALALLWTLISMALLKGGIAANAEFILKGGNMGGNIALSTFLDRNALLQRGVSLFSILKIFLILTNTIQNVDMNTCLRIYKGVAGICLIALSIYVVAVESTFWKRTTLLVFAMILFPHISADYRLIHIFIPMFLFVNADHHPKTHYFYAVMFALLLIPKDYILLPDIRSDSNAEDISIAVIVNAVMMLSVMA